MILTIYFIGILLSPIIIMLLFRIFPKFMKDMKKGTDFDISLVVAFCILIWPIPLVFVLVVGFYFGCYWLINLGNHKK